MLSRLKGRVWMGLKDAISRLRRVRPKMFDQEDAAVLSS